MGAGGYNLIPGLGQWERLRGMKRFSGMLSLLAYTHTQFSGVTQRLKIHEEALLRPSRRDVLCAHMHVEAAGRGGEGGVSSRLMQNNMHIT